MDIRDAVVNLDVVSSTELAATCPHCGRKYFGLGSKKLLDKTTKCTNCGNKFLFVEPRAVLVDGAPPHVDCPHCGRGNYTFMLLDQVDQLKKCEHCKRTFRIKPG